MSLFGNLTSAGLEESQDRLGGGFGAIETKIYSGIIKALYAGQSGKGARNVTLIADFAGREYRETIYITNRKGENFFTKDGKKVPLPGFTTIDDLCLVATGKPLAEQEAEDKMVKIYDAEAKKELPKTVPMIVEAIGKPISLAIVKQIVNKNVLNESTGEYEATAETREENFTDKVFDTDTKMTVNEARAGADTAAFWDGWLERNQGKTRDKRSVKEGEAGATGTPGAPKPRAAGSATPPAANQAAPRKSLFGKAA